MQSGKFGECNGLAALSPHPHDVDVKALTCLAIVYDIPFALNRATAEMVLAELCLASGRPL